MFIAQPAASHGMCTISGMMPSSTPDSRLRRRKPGLPCLERRNYQTTTGRNSKLLAGSLVRHSSTSFDALAVRKTPLQTLHEWRPKPLLSNSSEMMRTAWQQRLRITGYESGTHSGCTVSARPHRSHAKRSRGSSPRTRFTLQSVDIKSEIGVNWTAKIAGPMTRRSRAVADSSPFINRPLA
jgi:hypothetical protein